LGLGVVHFTAGSNLFDAQRSGEEQHVDVSRRCDEGFFVLRSKDNKTSGAIKYFSEINAIY
jgi:hypothetical protein